jgi:hypothetical protein
MSDELPLTRPEKGIDATDTESIRVWAAWLRVDEGQLRRLIAIMGSSVRELEYVLGVHQRPRW